MPPRGSRSWFSPMSFFRRRRYHSIPEDDTGDGARAEKYAPSPSYGPRSSFASSNWRTILIKLLPLLLIPLCVLLVIVFARRSIMDGVRRVTGFVPPLPPRPTSPYNKTHALPLEPINFNPEQPFRKALVMASFSKQHVEWLSELHSDWELFRYVLDNPNPISGLTVPRNQGREAMAYLTYIIDNYEDLPNFVVFHHGHRRAWHQPEPTPMKLKALNFTALAHDHYINLRCALDPGCTPDTNIDLVHEDPDDDRTQAHMLPRFWNTMFGNESIWDLGPPPTNVSIPCCAQFAVTKEAILSRPLAFWRSYRRPLERDLDEYKPLWGEKTNSYFIGICYEKLWHMVFGKPSRYCPSEDYCRGTQFSDAMVCDRYTAQFNDAKDWQNIKCIEKYQDG